MSEPHISAFNHVSICVSVHVCICPYVCLSGLSTLSVRVEYMVITIIYYCACSAQNLCVRGGQERANEEFEP